MTDNTEGVVMEAHGRATVYLLGICAASVCASNDMTPDDVIASVDSTDPTGLDHGWVLSDAATFSGGEPNPCPCNTQPGTHLHYLLEC